MADYDPVEHVPSASLSEEDAARVGGLSAAGLLGIPSDPGAASGRSRRR